jgi:hypothetical protein
MRAWPFLMGASDYSDYRVVVCPDFIERSGRAQIFRNVFDTSLDEDSGETVRSAHLRDDKIGSCSLFYRVRQIRERDGSSAYDAAGRPLLRVDGVVVQRNGSDDRLNPKEADRLIERALPTLDPSFTAFWTAKRKIPTAVSKQLDEEKAVPNPPQPPRRPRSPLILVLSSALTISVIANVTLALLGGRDAQTEQRLAATERQLTAAEQRLGAKEAELAAVRAELARYAKWGHEAER